MVSIENREAKNVTLEKLLICCEKKYRVRTKKWLMNEGVYMHLWI
jgi:hypothetical protein